MKKRFRFPIAVLLICHLFAFCSVFASASTGLEEQALPVVASVSAQSYLLMDAQTGEVLSQSHADTKLPMASTTKIMTCLVALEEGELSDEVVIPQEAVGIEGSSIYLTRGEELTLSDLLYGLMLESANDAAVAIALHISGSVDSFAEKMNEKASQLGMTNTHFCNPNGLQAEEHYSTARDLSVLMAYCMQNPVFAEMTATQTKNIPAPGGKSRYLSNHNRLLRSYEDCIGGKTGYTKTAGRCLVSAAHRDGKTLICTTLGAPDDWNDHKNLYRYGFSLYHTEILCEKGSICGTLPLVGGEQSEIAYSCSEALSISLREGQAVTHDIELPHFVYAPTRAGDYFGDAVFYLDEKELVRIPLVCEQDAPQKEVKLSFWQKLWNTIQSWF